MTGIPKNLRIRILASDFATSRYCDHQDCPVARAIVRDLCIAPDSDLISVGGNDVDFLYRTPSAITYLIPEHQAIKVSDMFKGLKPKDFTMTLTLKP